DRRRRGRRRGAARGLLHHARARARAGESERARRAARLYADGGYALRRAGLRGAGVVRRAGTRDSRRRRRAPKIRRGASSRLLLRRRGDKADRVRLVPARRRGATAGAAAAGGNEGGPDRAATDPHLRRSGLAGRPPAAPRHAARGRAPAGPRADRGPDLDIVRAVPLDGAPRRQRQRHPGAAVIMQERTTEPRTAPATEDSRQAFVLDPVDYAVISQALIAIAREMGTKLIRSSYSNIVREAQDASAALFDAAGNVVAQAELIPMHLGSMSEIFRACVDQCPMDRLRPGDFYINNDPYGGGQHLQDVFIFTPIFVDGRIIAFAGTVAHHLDLGGGNPGMTPDAVDVHAEGIIIPPSRYTYDRDWNGGPLERLIAANVRVPSQTIGDFYAQFAANAIGTARMQELAARYGVESVLAAMSELMNYSERRFRAALRA